MFNNCLIVVVRSLVSLAARALRPVRRRLVPAVPVSVVLVPRPVLVLVLVRAALVGSVVVALGVCSTVGHGAVRCGWRSGPECLAGSGPTPRREV